MHEINRHTQKTLFGESKDKDDSVRLPSRWEQYSIAKQHLRGTPRPEVFPIIEDGGEADGLQGHVANTLTARYYGAEAVGTYVGEGEQHAQEIRQLNDPTHSNNRVYDADGISPTLNTAQGGNRQPKILAHYGHINKEPTEMDISPTLKASSHGHEPMVMIPEATKKGYAEAKVGQSINLSVMGSKTRRGRVSDIAQTLDTGMQQHTISEILERKEDAVGRNMPVHRVRGIGNGYGIRRLTPMECERLQGFPDGWTEGVSDTQRYKCCGNAVTVNVIQAIATKLIT